MDDEDELVARWLRMSREERRAYVEAGGTPPRGAGDGGAASEFLDDMLEEERASNGS